MPTFDNHQKSEKQLRKELANDVRNKYAPYLPDRGYVELIQGDLSKRGLKDKYTRSQIYNFMRGFNNIVNIRLSVETVGRQYEQDEPQEDYGMTIPTEAPNL